MVSRLISELRARGVRLEVDGDALKVNAPRGALDAQLAASIRAHKPELLALLKTRGIASHATAPIPRRPDGEAPQLTSSQERIWTLAGLGRGIGSYNVPGAWWLRGPLDEARLLAAMRAFGERHDIFRYRIDEVGGHARVHLAAERGIPVTSVDLRAETGPEAAARAFVEASNEEPFDLTQQAPARLYLLHVAEQVHIICVIAHSVAWDGWSFDRLLHEVRTDYESALAGDAAVLPAPDLRFSDYAAWTREQADSPANAADLVWWEQQLAGPLPRLDLPRRPGHQALKPHGGRRHFSLDADLTTAIRALARQADASVPMLLFAAYAALLGRWTGAADVVVTLPVRGRERPELESLVGVFTNTVFLRLQVDPRASFKDLLARARDVSLESMERQAAPVEHVLERLGGRLGGQPTALFQAQLSIQHSAERPASMGEAALIPVHHDVRGANMELMLWFRDDGGALAGAVDYRADLLETDTITRLVDHLTRLLDAAVHAPDSALESLQIMSPEELELVTATYAMGAPRPSRPGAGWPWSGLSGPLVEETRAIAGALGQLQLSPGSAIALWRVPAERLPAAILGTLAAGHAVACLPADEPDARLPTLLAATTAAAVLTDAHAAPDVVALGLPPLDLSAIGGETQGSDPAAGGALRWPDDLGAAAVVPTDPGRRVAARAPWTTLGDLLDAAAALPPLEPTDRLLLATAPECPGFVAELLSALASGATVQVATPEEISFDWDLRDALRRSAATVLHASVPTLRTLLQLQPPPPLPRRILARGEGLDPALAGQLVPHTELWWVDGPERLGGVALLHRLESAADAGLLGHAAPGRCATVRDGSGRVLPLGAIGGLHVQATGEGAAAEPIATRHRARWRADGALESAGSSASRFEVHPIVSEAVGRLPGVVSAVVGFPEAAAGEPVPTAWLTTDARGAPSPAAVRRALMPRFGPREIPALIVELEAMPLLSDGTIDLGALPSPFEVEAVDGALRDGLERAIARVFVEVLGVPAAGPHDAFFELGGSSMLALRALVRLEEETGFRPSPRLLFFQTVRQLAERGDAAAAGEGGP